MWASAVIQLLIAIFKAFPSIESIVKTAFEAAEKAKRAEALNRKEAKDKLVDDAIDKREGMKNEILNS